MISSQISQSVRLLILRGRDIWNYRPGLKLGGASISSPNFLWIPSQRWISRKSFHSLATACQLHGFLIQRNVWSATMRRRLISDWLRKSTRDQRECWRFSGGNLSFHPFVFFWGKPLMSPFESMQRDFSLETFAKSTEMLLAWSAICHEWWKSWNVSSKNSAWVDNVV